jgi:hypothetical protein
MATFFGQKKTSGRRWKHKNVTFRSKACFFLRFFVDLSHKNSKNSNFEEKSDGNVCAPKKFR